MRFKFNRKANDYHYYTCQILDNGTITIYEGFTYQNDAKGRIKEVKEEGHLEGRTLKVYTFATCKRLGIDPNNNANWKDLQ